MQVMLYGPKEIKNPSILYSNGTPSASNSTPTEIVGIVGVDNILSNFVEVYQRCSSENMDALLTGLLMSYTSKMNGIIYAKYSSSIINLAQVIRLKSKAAYTVLQANLLLPSIRHLQRLETQSY